MAVATAQVETRRTLRFENFDEMLAEVERLHSTPHRALGNWTLGQALGHLGRAMIGSVDGEPFRVPLHLKIIGRLFIRRRLLNHKFPAGFQLPRSAAKKLIPEPDCSYEEGLATLHEGLDRLKQSDRRIAHPVIGRLNVEQWNRFHLRHAELHLGFFQLE